MSGQKLLGIPVVVQVTEAEKNRLAMQAQNAYVFSTMFPLTYFPMLTRTFVTT
jgi:RNA-binding protein 39